MNPKQIQAMKPHKKTPAIKLLEDWKHKAEITAIQARCPSYPVAYLPRHKYTDKTANGLTRAIIDFISLHGWQAERINTTGRIIDNSKTFTDVAGRVQTLGRAQWVPGTSTAGSADISATIAGKAVKIEVKTGSDRQSQAQKDYQKAIEAAGGVYYIARNFDLFFEWYNANFTEGQPWK
ncbi:MAG TPA: hypothetical protein DCM62_10150 [Bacteroidales bacterium]|nr:hypothetical protein [Bacteroidales bacterium]